MYSNTSEILADVLARIGALCETHGRKQAVDLVAKAGGVSESLVRKLIYAERTNPTAESLDRILAGIAAVEQQDAA